MTEDKSALVVTVKPALLDWLRRQGISRPYHSEEDCVWLIPSSSSFPNEEAFRSYLEAMQSTILDAELERFGRNLRERVLAEHEFEELVEVSVRDHVEVGPPLSP